MNAQVLVTLDGHERESLNRLRARLLQGTPGSAETGWVQTINDILRRAEAVEREGTLFTAPGKSDGAEPGR